MTLKMDRRVFYGVVAVVLLAAALGAGVLASRLARPSGPTAQPAAPASDGAPTVVAGMPTVAMPTADPTLAALPQITIADAFARFEKGDAVFVDARAAAEFQVEHVPGALNIPYTDAEARMGELPTDKTVIVYCA